MATASGDPEALRTYATDTADAVAELRAQARQLAQLLDEFNAADKQLGAAVANHGHELAALGERMAELDAFVGQVGDAFAVADQGPMFAPPAPGARRVTLDEDRLARQVPIGDLTGAASRVESRVAAGIHAGRATVHGTRWVHARSRLYYLHREYYRPDTFWPDPDSYRRAEQQRRAALQRRIHHTGARPAPPGGHCKAPDRSPASATGSNRPPPDLAAGYATAAAPWAASAPPTAASKR